MALEVTVESECPYCGNAHQTEELVGSIGGVESDVLWCDECEKPFARMWSAVAKVQIRAIDGYTKKVVKPVRAKK